MCSTAEQRLAEIGRAIDDLAAKARGEQGAAERRAQAGDRDEVVGKVAELWALLAELDPDIARRMSGYQLD
jgi:ribosomal protein L17